MDVHVPRAVPISYEMVAKAYQKVKQGGKASGVDGESWNTFIEKGVEKQLYVIWNRLSSGSYHPQAVREVEIPKANGKKRKLGIPTLRDRIAQEVVKNYMEKKLEEKFHSNSYGYRPMKSSHDALEEVRQNCLTYDWVVDVDIRQFFDEIDHALMLEAVAWTHTEKWVKNYVQRWLEMKIEKPDGNQYDRGGKGTPQGGVISPLLSNLFLHYALDMWLSKHHPQVRFVRYADDMVVHCSSKSEADAVMAAIRQRLDTVKLKLNEEKSKVVYCKDYRRKEKHPIVQFGFLGFSFQPRQAQSKHSVGTSFTAYTAEVSKDNRVKIRQSIRESVNWRDTTQDMQTIAADLNARLRGWINYFGLFGKRQLRYTLMYLDTKLIKWLKRKHKVGYRKALQHLNHHQQNHPTMFYHWQRQYCIVVNKLTRAV